MVFKNRLVLGIGGRHIEKDLQQVGLGVKYGLEWLDLRQELVEVTCDFQAVWWISLLGEELLDSQERLCSVEVASYLVSVTC